MLDKFARDDNIEQMTAQKRRLKQLDHKRAVEDLLEGENQSPLYFYLNSEYPAVNNV